MNARHRRAGAHGAAAHRVVLEQCGATDDPNLPLYAVRTGEELIAAQLAQRRFATRLINAFAASALLLAAFGLHGIIAYGVRQRRHEIGVRIALGATAARMIGLVLGQAARLAAGGMAVGLAGAFMFAQLIGPCCSGSARAIRGRSPRRRPARGAVVGLATMAPPGGRRGSRRRSRSGRTECIRCSAVRCPLSGARGLDP